MKCQIDYQLLKQKSIEVAKLAYAPYSKFRVGSALLLKDGNIIVGCNVENISFGLTNCGERSAIFAAISQGYSREDFVAMALHSPDSSKHLSPCGACRQVLCEFVKDDFPILLGNATGDFIEVNFASLMPQSFNEF